MTVNRRPGWQGTVGDNVRAASIAIGFAIGSLLGWFLLRRPHGKRRLYRVGAVSLFAISLLWAWAADSGMYPAMFGPFIAGTTWARAFAPGRDQPKQ